MPPVKDEAIVLRRLDYSETSQVLLFLTRLHGPRRLIAKGIKRGTKKKFATGIDLLEKGRLMFLFKSSGDAGLGTLTEWVQLDAYLGLRSRLQNNYAAQYGVEVTAALTEEADPHPELFDGLARLLSQLSGEDDWLESLVQYQQVLLQSIGLWPDLGRCVMCDRTAPPGRAGYFSAIQGGLICRQCQPLAPGTQLIDAGTLESLRSGTPDRATAPGRYHLLNDTLTSHMGRPPKVARFLHLE